MILIKTNRPHLSGKLWPRTDSLKKPGDELSCDKWAFVSMSINVSVLHLHPLTSGGVKMTAIEYASLSHNSQSMPPQINFNNWYTDVLYFKIKLHNDSNTEIHMFQERFKASA